MSSKFLGIKRVFRLWPLAIFAPILGLALFFLSENLDPNWFYLAILCMCISTLMGVLFTGWILTLSDFPKSLLSEHSLRGRFKTGRVQICHVSSTV